ncbi:MAG: hypothetical protein ABIO70_15245 [Pseudomonadota bacterium]
MRALALLFALAGCDQPAPSAPDTIAAGAPARATIAEPLRIGWQSTWATQGQLAQILVHTDLLTREGYAPELVGFTHDGPLNEAALAGEVDVVLAADQPALMLCARDPHWRIVGRLMASRVGTFVPTGSTAQSIADLEGGKVAIPDGAAAQRETLAALREAGLTPGEDVFPVNMGLAEQLALVEAGATDGRWGEIAAGSAWDPALARLETSKKVRLLAHGVVTSVVLMDSRYLVAHRGADAAFLRALAGAYDTFRADRAQADAWFNEASGATWEAEVLELSGSVEQNLNAQRTGPARTRLSGVEITGLVDAAAFMADAGLLSGPLDVGALIRQPREDR